MPARRRNDATDARWPALKNGAAREGARYGTRGHEDAARRDSRMHGEGARRGARRHGDAQRTGTSIFKPIPYIATESIIVAAAAAAVAVAAQPRQGGRTRLVPTAVGKSVSRTGGAPGARAAECRTRAWTRPGFPKPSFF